MNIAIEYVILFLLCVTTLIMIWRFVPEGKIRDFQIVFLFLQTVTWILGLNVVEWGLIQYPIREFPDATEMNFILPFVVYPAIGGFYVLYYPEHKQMLHKINYSLMWAAGIGLLAMLLERCTDLIQYVKWNMFLSFLLSLAINGIALVFYRWFRRAFWS